MTIISSKSSAVWVILRQPSEEHSYRRSPVRANTPYVRTSLLPAITVSLEYTNEDFRSVSEFMGIASMVFPLNLYRLPDNDGMIRTNSP